MRTTNYHIKELSREEAVAIYRDIAPAHFPSNELKPVAAIEALYDRNAYLGLGLYQNTSETLIGYALFLTVQGLDTVLLDYYAILEEYRELGLGSFFLQGMKSFFPDKAGVLIETEDPDCAENEEEALLRNRRNAFYYKNGAHQTGIACTLFGVPFQIQFMPTGECDNFPSPFSAKENIAQDVAASFFRKNMEATYLFMLPEAVYHQNVIWR